jgi:ATP-dependent RNA helicase RhlE
MEDHFLMSYNNYSQKKSNTGRRNYGGRSSFRGNRGGGKVQKIDASRFVKVATLKKVEDYAPVNQFVDFDLQDILQTNLKNRGYVIPSPIQDQAIPIALTGKDVIGIAGTGTGKTAAFALPMLKRLIADKNSKAIIIAPTRELAQQIEQEIRLLAKGTGLSGVILIGGTSMGMQLRDLRHNPRIVIGTPGRIKDHINRGTLKLRSFNLIALDEVDRMLDMGFINDVTEILSNVNEVRQSYFFSATIDNKVRTLIDTFSEEPHMISLQPSAASDSVHQNVVRYNDRNHKIEQLHEVLIDQDVAKVIVFDETQRGVERLKNELADRGFTVDAIHGGKTQGQRQRSLSRFKNNETTILVATDVAARGIDVADITHVINYSVPKAYDDYIHRIGRAGRAGKVGFALTFIER